MFPSDNHLPPWDTSTPALSSWSVPQVNCSEVLSASDESQVKVQQDRFSNHGLNISYLIISNEAADMQEK